MAAQTGGRLQPGRSNLILRPSGGLGFPSSNLLWCWGQGRRLFREWPMAEALKDDTIPAVLAAARAVARKHASYRQGRSTPDCHCDLCVAIRDHDFIAQQEAESMAEADDPSVREA